MFQSVRQRRALPFQQSHSNIRTYYCSILVRQSTGRRVFFSSLLVRGHLSALLRASYIWIHMVMSWSHIDPLEAQPYWHSNQHSQNEGWWPSAGFSVDGFHFKTERPALARQQSTKNEDWWPSGFSVDGFFTAKRATSNSSNRQHFFSLPLAWERINE